MNNNVIVRHTCNSDIAPLIELQKLSYPNLPTWKKERLVNQLETFPQGQIVAEFDGKLVGAANALIVLWDEWQDVVEEILTLRKPYLEYRIAQSVPRSA